MEDKVGDQVRIISNKSGHRYKIGEVLLIEEVDINGLYGGYLIDGYRWWFTSKCCELVNPMEDNNTSKEQPMTVKQATKKAFLEEFLFADLVIDKMKQTYPVGMNYMFKSMEYYKDAHTAPMQSEIDRLNKAVEELNNEIVRLNSEVSEAFQAGQNSIGADSHRLR